MKKIKDSLKQLDSIPLPDKGKILSFNNKDFSIEAKENISKNTSNNKRLKFKPAWSFSIILAVLMISFSGYTIVAEELEYKEAVNFFVENGLSTEGLSRNDIKGVYRDITTKKFSHNKTAEIIEKNVAGHEIFQEEPSPKDIENLWNFKNNGHYIIKNNYTDNKDTSYVYQYTEQFDDKLGYNVYKAKFVKYDRGQELWSTELDNFSINGFTVSNDLIIVYGTSISNSSFQSDYGRLALLNSKGEILWDKTTANDFKDEYISSALFDNDNIITFSRGDLKYLCFTEYDIQGNRIRFTKNEVGNYGIYSAVKLDENYLVQLKSGQNGEMLMKVNNDGSLSDSFSYSSADMDYYITNMIEYNGNVFLSAYSVKKPNDDERNAGGRYDISRVLNYIFDNKKFDITNDELTKLVRENFTAVLLICNPETGVPNEFYSVNGSIGAKLFINEDKKLIWETENISDTYLSLATSSFTIGGASYIYRYEFDESGKIVEIEKTGEVTTFRR